MCPQTEIRSILSDNFCELRKRNPSLSLRAYAKKLNMVPSAVSEILNKNRTITPRMAEKILSNLKISEDRSNNILHELISNRQWGIDTSRFSGTHQINSVDITKISDWYYFAILSLAETDDFISDIEWIAERLNITKLETGNAIKTLLSLNLLACDVNGNWVPTGVAYTTTNDISDKNIRKQHKQNMKLAVESLELDNLFLRDLTSMTMAIDPTKIPEAKRMIKDFRYRICEFLEDGAKQEVYKLNVQLVPVSRRRQS